MDNEKLGFDWDFEFSDWDFELRFGILIRAVGFGNFDLMI